MGDLLIPFILICRLSRKGKKEKEEKLKVIAEKWEKRREKRRKTRYRANYDESDDYTTSDFGPSDFTHEKYDSDHDDKFRYA